MEIKPVRVEEIPIREQVSSRSVSHAIKPVVDGIEVSIARLQGGVEDLHPISSLGAAQQLAASVGHSLPDQMRFAFLVHAHASSTSVMALLLQPPDVA